MAICIAGVSRRRVANGTTTHDDAATEILGSVEHTLGHSLAEPFCAARENREERAHERAGEDDEDGGDSEASVGLGATA